MPDIFKNRSETFRREKHGARMGLDRSPSLPGLLVVSDPQTAQSALLNRSPAVRADLLSSRSGRTLQGLDFFKDIQ